MSKSLHRLVALILLPALLGDPTLALGLSNETRAFPIPHFQCCPVFTTQALGPVELWFAHLRESRLTMRPLRVMARKLLNSVSAFGGARPLELSATSLARKNTQGRENKIIHEALRHGDYLAFTNEQRDKVAYELSRKFDASVRDITRENMADPDNIGIFPTANHSWIVGYGNYVDQLAKRRDEYLWALHFLNEFYQWRDRKWFGTARFLHWGPFRSLLDNPALRFVLIPGLTGHGVLAHAGDRQGTGPKTFFVSPESIALIRHFTETDFVRFEQILEHEERDLQRGHHVLDIAPEHWTSVKSHWDGSERLSRMQSRIEQLGRHMNHIYRGYLDMQDSLSKGRRIWYPGVWQLENRLYQRRDFTLQLSYDLSHMERQLYQARNDAPTLNRVMDDIEQQLRDYTGWNEKVDRDYQHTIDWYQRLRDAEEHGRFDTIFETPREHYHYKEKEKRKTEAPSPPSTSKLDAAYARLRLDRRQLLQLSRSEAKSMARRRYLAMVRDLHTDQLGGSSDSGQFNVADLELALVNDAYDQVKDDLDNPHTRFAKGDDEDIRRPPPPPSPRGRGIFLSGAVQGSIGVVLLFAASLMMSLSVIIAWHVHPEMGRGLFSTFAREFSTVAQAFHRPKIVIKALEYSILIVGIEPILSRRLFVGILSVASLLGQQRPRSAAPPNPAAPPSPIPYQTAAQYYAIRSYVYGLRQVYAGEPGGAQALGDAIDVTKDIGDPELTKELDLFAGRILVMRESRPARLVDRDAWMQKFVSTVQEFNDHYLDRRRGWLLIPTSGNLLFRLGEIEKQEDKLGVHVDSNHVAQTLELTVYSLEMQAINDGSEPETLQGATEFGPPSHRSIATDSVALKEEKQNLENLYNAVSPSSRRLDAFGPWLRTFIQKAYEKDGIIKNGQLVEGGLEALYPEYLLHEAIHAFNGNTPGRLQARNEAFAYLTTVLQKKIFGPVSKLVQIARENMEVLHDRPFDPENPGIGMGGLLGAYALAKAMNETGIAADLLAYKPDALEALAEKIMALDPDTLSQKADIARQTAGAGLDFHDGRFDVIDRPKPAPPASKKKARALLFLPLREFFRSESGYQETPEGGNALEQTAA